MAPFGLISRRFGLRYLRLGNVPSSGLAALFSTRQHPEFPRDLWYDPWNWLHKTLEDTGEGFPWRRGRAESKQIYAKLTRTLE